jgi:3',5'-cyclic AMP phosphodiesterase CpdA
MKQIKSLHNILLAVALFMLFGCGGGGGDANPVTPSADSFKFIVISDVHVRLPGNLDDAVYDNAKNREHFNGALDLIKTNHPDADFVIVNGDNTGCLFSHSLEDYGIGEDNPAETFKTMMDSLGMPFYVALGNHDYQDGFNVSARQGITASDPASMEAVWKKVLGIDPYYSFVHKGVRFIILNSTRGPSYTEPCPSATVETGCKGSFDNAQMAWLETELQSPEPCLIFIHHPVITDHNALKTWSAAGLAMQVRADDRFYAVARSNKDRIKGIFVGHGHLKEKDTLEDTIPVHETASIGDTGGSSNNIRIVWMDPITGKMLTD